MAGKKGENTKKVAGNARKAEQAAQKAAAADKAAEAAEADKWSKGSKSNAKKYVMTQRIGRPLALVSADPHLRIASASDAKLTLV